MNREKQTEVENIKNIINEGQPGYREKWDAFDALKRVDGCCLAVCCKVRKCGNIDINSYVIP
jgi:hypothetical protein